MLLCYDNLADIATLSGGSWESALPLTRLQDRRLSVRARSTSTDATVIINLGKAYAIKGVALAGHNLTLNATLRVTASASSDFATLTYDSGTISAWPGLTTQAQADQYQGLAHVCGAETLATRRYWKIEISDAGNPDNYVEFGRLFIGSGWSVDGPSYGWSLGYEDASLIETSLGGTEYYDERTKHRVLTFGLPDIDASGFQANILPTLQRSGTTREVLVFIDPDDAEMRIRAGLLGRFRTMSPIENTDPLRWASAFEVKELIA